MIDFAKKIGKPDSEVYVYTGKWKASQFLLAETYIDMFDDKTRLSVFNKDADNFELHHIIPLGSVKNLAQSTNELRDKKDHIYNSPLNFVYITKSANLAISSKSLSDYAKEITATSKSALFINSYVDSNSVSTEQKVKSILEIRYDTLKGKIQDRISQLLI